MLLGARMGRDCRGKGVSLELIEFLRKARAYSGAKPGVVSEVGVLGLWVPSLSHTAVAAVLGWCAGSVQALVATPAESVRTVLEGGASHGSWSVAWKEVFAGAKPLSRSLDRREVARHYEEVRKVRQETVGTRGAWYGWQGVAGAWLRRCKGQLW